MKPPFRNSALLSHVLGSVGPPPVQTVFTATVQYDPGFTVLAVQLYPPNSTVAQGMTKQSDSGSTQVWTSQQAPVPQAGKWIAVAQFQLTNPITSSGSDTV
jgi:hypothetical protein